MQAITIYHNPRCSKSRQTLQLLEEHGIEPTIIKYLDQPPNEAQIKQLLKQLQLAPRDLIRKSEPEYKDNYLNDDSLNDEQLIQALLDFPILLQRPIVSSGNKAAIGRPPENVLSLLESSE